MDYEIERRIIRVIRSAEHEWITRMTPGTACRRDQHQPYTYETHRKRTQKAIRRSTLFYWQMSWTSSMDAMLMEKQSDEHAKRVNEMNLMMNKCTRRGTGCISGCAAWDDGSIIALEAGINKTEGSRKATTILSIETVVAFCARFVTRLICSS